jgi:hypothetical protein
MACLNTNWSELFNTPPNARIETFAPVLPNGLVGTTIWSAAIVEELPQACLMEPNCTSGVTKPAAPAILIKSLLENFIFLPDMPNFSFPDFQ